MTGCHLAKEGTRRFFKERLRQEKRRQPATVLPILDYVSLASLKSALLALKSLAYRKQQITFTFSALITPNQEFKLFSFSQHVPVVGSGLIHISHLTHARVIDSLLAHDKSIQTYRYSTGPK